MINLGDEQIMIQLVAHANRRGVEIDVTTNTERRSLVLKHPDLAARLTEKPMGYAKPEQWNGYVGPELLPTGARNPSRTRAQVADIYAEALRRERS